jgi:hypothetical protein
MVRILSTFHTPALRILALAIGIACLASGMLHAQTIPTQTDSAAEDESSRDHGLQPHSKPYKSPLAAMGLSVLATALPLIAGAQIPASENKNSNLTGILWLGGILIGPSAGQFYAASPGTGMLGIGLRSTGLALFVIGLKSAFNSWGCSDDGGSNCDESGGATFMVIGSLTFIGGGLYSLFDAALAADRFNDRERKTEAFGWTPTLAPGRDGVWKSGAVAWMRF